MRKSLVIIALTSLVIGGAAALYAADAPAEKKAANKTASGAPFDWPMWGRTPSRNMVSPEKNPPVDFDFEKGKNIKWKAAVGSKSYGNPVIAGGLVFVGSNNEHHSDPKLMADG